jgi:hypothetical protein
MVFMLFSRAQRARGLAGGNRAPCDRYHVRMWSSPFLRLHLLHAAVLYAGARVLLTVALLWGANPALGEPTVIGVHYTLIAIVVTVALMQVNRRRLGAPDLLENLGFGARAQLIASAMVALVGEIVLALLLSRSDIV